MFSVECVFYSRSCAVMRHCGARATAIWRRRERERASERERERERERENLLRRPITPEVKLDRVFTTAIPIYSNAGLPRGWLFFLGTFRCCLLSCRGSPRVALDPVMRELPLALPLRLWDIMACNHRCKNATRSAVHESGATPSLTTSRHLLSTPQISLCRPVLRHPPNAAFFEAIFW